MRKCVRCGKPAGMFYTYCPECIDLSPAERNQPPTALGSAGEPTATTAVTDSAGAPAPAAPSEPFYYATFPRRLNALSADTLLLVLLSVAIFALIPLAQGLGTIRVALVFGWWVVLLLYEPATVAWLGGTIGHRLLNLRVVDDNTGGNVSFGKAIGRLFIKALLGVLSFFTMAFSRRHQAIHDMATRSTVQIRDLSRARPHHYIVRHVTPGPRAT